MTTKLANIFGKAAAGSVVTAVAFLLAEMGAAYVGILAGDVNKVIPFMGLCCKGIIASGLGFSISSIAAAAGQLSVRAVQLATPAPK